MDKCHLAALGTAHHANPLRVNALLREWELVKFLLSRRA
jgi:hypothetical protein